MVEGRLAPSLRLIGAVGNIGVAGRGTITSTMESGLDGRNPFELYTEEGPKKKVRNKTLTDQ